MYYGLKKHNNSTTNKIDLDSKIKCVISYLSINNKYYTNIHKLQTK